MFGHSVGLIEVLILGVAGIAVVTDLRRRRIYNVLTMPAMLAGLALNTVMDGFSGLGWALAGFGLGAALFFIPVALGGMGAGDLKLLAALGAIGGPGFVFWCAIYTSIVGGALGVAMLLSRRQFIPVFGPMVLSVTLKQMPRATSNIRLPYAVPIAVGAVTALMLNS
ncbi:MAG: A24 family peptidase [Thermomicrobiales bacterium]